MSGGVRRDNGGAEGQHGGGGPAVLLHDHQRDPEVRHQSGTRAQAVPAHGGALHHYRIKVCVVSVVHSVVLICSRQD